MVAFTLRDGVALTWLGLGLGLGSGLVLGLVLGRGSGSPARRRWLARSARRIFSCLGYRLVVDVPAQLFPILELGA